MAIIRPYVRDFYIYIDDGGLQDINSPGFAFLMMDQFTADSIRKAVDHAKASHNMKKLHANQINKRNYKTYKQIYQAVFGTAVHELKRANWGNILCRYSTTKEYKRVQGFVQNTLQNMLRQKNTVLNHNMKMVVEIAEYVLFPLMVLVELKKITKDEGVNIHIILDRKKRFDVDINKIIGCNGNIYSGLVPIKTLLMFVVNVWFDTVFRVIVDKKNKFQISSVNILRSWNDSLVELADALSYFSFQFFKCNIDNYQSSENDRYKSAFFQEILKSINENIDIESMKKFINENWRFQNREVFSKSEQSVYVLDVIQIQNETMHAV